MVRFAAILIAFSCMLTAADTAFGTREEAVAMVKKGVAYIEKVGSAEAFAEMTKTNGMFIDRDLYLFALDFNGVSLANGQNAKLVGNNLSDMKDINGFPFVKEMIALMKKTNAGWVVYQWNNKKTGKIDPKASYVVRVGTNALIGCGVLDVAKKK